MKLRNMIAAAALGIICCSMTVSAAGNKTVLLNTEADVQKTVTGSISIHLTEGGVGTSQEGVVFACAKVADWKDGSYEMPEVYRKSGVNLNQIQTSDELDSAAKTLVKYAEPEGRAATDKEGKAKIGFLTAGAYLLYAEQQGKYDVVTPILISVPTWGEAEGDMLYDVTVIPKHEPLPPGTVVTDTPDKHHLGVKTGDETDMAKIAVVSAVSAGIIGFIYHRRRRSHDEK